MDIKVDGDTMIIEIDISIAAMRNAPKSSTGKSTMLATTSGFTSIATPNGPVKLSVNCIKSDPAK